MVSLDRGSRTRAVVSVFGWVLHAVSHSHLQPVTGWWYSARAISVLVAFACHHSLIAMRVFPKMSALDIQ